MLRKLSKRKALDVRQFVCSGLYSKIFRLGLARQFFNKVHFCRLVCYNIIMENIKKQWPEEKAEKHLKISAALIVVGGIAGLIMGIEDFVTLGTRISTFILPYSYNIAAIGVSLFQIYLGIAWFEKKLWSKYAIFGVIGLRFMFGFFDFAEAWHAIILLIYLLYVIPDSKIGRLFKKEAY